MDEMVQNPEAQKLAQMLQQQQMQKLLQQLQGAGSGMGAMSELDRQQMQRQPVPMFGQQIPQGDFTQGAVPMLGQPMPQGSMGSRPVPMPYSNSPSGVSAQEYEMMRKMPR
tara:strand:+ start:689 stop:1021 length:333 start_codon:yes stop_codon:yes gene_type:complete